MNDNVGEGGHGCVSGYTARLPLLKRLFANQQPTLALKNMVRHFSHSSHICILSFILPYPLLLLPSLLRPYICTSPRASPSPPCFTPCTFSDPLSTLYLQDDSSHSIRAKAQREVALHQAVAHLPSGTHLPHYAIRGERTST